MPGKKAKLKRSSAAPICDMDRTIRPIGPTNILEADRCTWRNRIQAGGQVGTIWMSNVAQARVEVRPGEAAKRFRRAGMAYPPRLRNSWAAALSCAPVHLLIACERAVRSAGETNVGRSLKSSDTTSAERCRWCRPAMNFAAHSFRGCPRTAYIYLGPKTLAEEEIEFTKVDLTPRPFFENTVLWATATKLSGLVENPGTASRLYAETSLPARQFLRSEAASQRRDVGGDERRSTLVNVVLNLRRRSL
jgi:hypothetical protein